MRRRQRRAQTKRSRRLWGLAYVAATGFVGVAASALLARQPPAGPGWWVQTTGVLLPILGPLSLPAAIGLGVAARRGKRFGGGMFAVALGAIFLAWAARTDAPPRAPAGADALRIVTLNVAETHSGREGLVADYVEALDADLVLFQEAEEDWGPYALVAGRILALGDYELRTDSSEGLDDAGRQVMLSKLPVLAYESGFLAAQERRSGVYGRMEVDWKGTRVAVYNVHLRAFNPEEGWSRERMLDPAVWAETPENLRAFYAEQAVESEALLERIEAETIPVIVAGDFNASPEQWSRTLLSRSLREVTGRWRPSATRPDGLPLVNVDGILVSHAWAVADASVGPRGFSDHRAVTAALALER